MFANVGLQAADAVMADDKPELERSKAAAEGDLPITIVEDRAGVTGFVAQVFGRDGERVGKGVPVADEEAVAIKVCEQPLVSIEAKRVGIFNTVDDGAKFRADRGGTCMGGIDMQPRSER